jgi:hypothetical protein
MILFIIIIIFILLLIFSFRNYFFSISSSLTNEEYTKLGYGYYSDPIETECINQSGKCSEKGIISQISYCVPNEKTKRGCIKKGGIQTFESKIVEKNCIASCRYSIWSETKVSDCVPKDKFFSDDCVFNNKGIRTLEKKCIQNDAYGMNTCSYDINTNSKIFDGCSLNSNGYTVNCNIGSIYHELESCNLENFPKCGKWKIDQEAYILNPNIAKNFYEECLPPGNEVFETNECYDFGYTIVPFYCHGGDGVCSKNYNCIDETTQLGRITIYNNIINNIPTVVCNQGIFPGCVKKCKKVKS